MIKLGLSQYRDPAYGWVAEKSMREQIDALPAGPRGPRDIDLD
jgi:hypothetical protein